MALLTKSTCRRVCVALSLLIMGQHGLAAAHNENYYTYQFPMRSSELYDSLNANAPDWVIFDPFNEGTRAWAYQFLKKLAHANELLQQSNLRLASKYAEDAASIYPKELFHCFATVPD